MTINQLIDTLKSKGQYREAGVVAAVNGKDRRYGCHFGLRSGLYAAQEAFYAGFDDFTLELRAALASN